jgi:PAS domain S-box-containing protein
MLKASNEKSDGSVLENGGANEDVGGANSAVSAREEADKILYRYRLLSEKARDIIWLMRPDGQIIEVNEAAVKTYGYSREELLRMNIRDLREKSTLGVLEKQLKKAGDGGIQFETVHVRKDGTTFPVEVNSTGANFGGERLIMSIVRDISERRAAENDLKRQKALLEALSETILDGVLIVSPEGRLVHYNQHFLDVWKFPEKVLQSGLDEAALEWAAQQTADPKAFLERVAAIYENPDREVREELRMKDGRVYERFGAPIGKGDDKYGWVWTFRDITERKLSEARLKLLAEISELLRKFESPRELLFAVSKIVGEHLRVKRCLFNEIDLENDLEIVHRDYCREVNSVAGVHKISDYSSITTDEMICGKIVVNKDSKIDPRTAATYEKIYQPNGERAYVAVPLLREGRWVASLWVSDDRPRDWSSQDVSLLETVAGRTWSVVEKLRTDAALRESEERFVKAFNSSPLSVTITSLRTGRLVDVNDTFVNLTGYAREEAVGKTTAELGLWSNPPDRENELSSVMREGKIRNLEYVFRMRNGSEIVGLLSAELIEIGGEQCALTVIQDITDRKQVERERERLLRNERELRREAEEANRLKDEFLATVSHELRTPLNAILGWSAMVRQSGFDVEMMRRAFEIVERNSRNQNQIISDILDVSRIITGKLSLNMETVALQTIIQSAVDTLRPAIEAKNIKLEMRLDPEIEFINGDADRLQQIFWNLLSNAVKFNSDGGNVEINLYRKDDYTEITVSDDGSGIEPEFIPFVFDRFRQADAKTNRMHGGLGLGLAIVRHLTELHGGSVSVESAGSGKGSKFTVRLPLKFRANDAETSVNADFNSETGYTPRKRLAGIKILIVDDQADSLELASFILTSENAEVFAADSVDKALEIFDRENLNLVITDIGMPEKDGYELIREIKQRVDGKTPAVATLALTAYAGEDDNRRVLQAGFQAYMPKPVEPSKLIERVIALIDAKRENRT